MSVGDLGQGVNPFNLGLWNKDIIKEMSSGPSYKPKELQVPDLALAQYEGPAQDGSGSFSELGASVWALANVIPSTSKKASTNNNCPNPLLTRPEPQKLEVETEKKIDKQENHEEAHQQGVGSEREKKSYHQVEVPNHQIEEHQALSEIQSRFRQGMMRERKSQVKLRSRKNGGRLPIRLQGTKGFIL